MNKEFGVNICGFISGEFGIAEGARSTIRSLEAANVPMVINNIDSLVTHRQNDRTYSNFSADNPFPINIIQINGDQVSELGRKIGPKYFENKYNIGYWAWELNYFPETWKPSIYNFDEIWTPSSYCVEAFSPVSPIPVLKMPHSVKLPAPTKTRRAMNLPEDKYIFVFVFDFASVYERKNPSSVVEAFRRAFDDDDDALLVLKSTNGEICREPYKNLKNLIGKTKNIRLLNGFWDKMDVCNLIAACDCYVSLHRAEGFGLTIAEAMFYGKPTIATAYSANTEFANINNSYPIHYRTITLEADFGHYGKGGVWAEPSIAHAAETMREVFEQPEKAKKIGEKAAADVRSTLAPEVIGEKMKQRLGYIAFIKNNFSEQTGARNLPETTRLRIEAEQQRERRKQIEQRIGEMEKSRFWEIRNRWFQIKDFWRKKVSK